MGPVLIVEDDSAIRSLVEDVLTDEGYATIAAANGAEALAVLDETRPACLLLDLHMPVLDGHAVLRTLDERGIQIPVVVMTSDPRVERLGPADGVIDTVSKPFDLDHLAAAVAVAATTSP